MAQQEFDTHYFAEDPVAAWSIWNFVRPFASRRPGDERARLVSADGSTSVEVTAAVADAIRVVSFLMSEGHGVEIRGVDGLLTIDQVAELTRQRPSDVQTAIENGLLATGTPSGNDVSMVEALLYENHVRAERRLLLDDVSAPEREEGHDTDRTDPGR